MQYFRKPLALIFSLSFFLFSFLTLLPIPSHAAIDLNPAALVDFVKNIPKDNPWSLAKDFCDKRNGDLMNLETWFSGKCGKDINSKSGEGVGFVDIIILQAYEWILHPQYKSLPEQIIDTLTDFYNFADKLTYNNYPERLAILNKNRSNNNDFLSKFELATKSVITNKPASSTDYLAYVSNNLKNNHIIDSAYAATPGYGFTGLAPILPLWRAFRNIAYMLFAIAFVMYGIMIMFRIRIDGRTAATIQLAIPKLISTLLLITFSYAIVGLLIDISTVATALSIDVLRVGNIVKSPIGGIINGVSGQSWFGGFGSFVINTLTSLVVSPFVIFNLLLGGALGTWIGAIAAVVGLLTGFGELIAIIIIIAVLWSYFTLIVKLFKSYLSIIISLIFSPIMLLGNVLPGSKAFSKWVMGIIGNLAVFPAAAFLLTLSYSLMVQPIVNLFPGATWLGVNSLSGNAAGTLWSPPMTVATGGNNGDIMLATIGLGLLLMASKYVDMVMKAFNVELFPYGAAIGEALKFGYNQTGDEKSGFRQSRLGGLASSAEGLYDKTTGRITGKSFWQSTSPYVGEPKA